MPIHGNTNHVSYSNSSMKTHDYYGYWCMTAQKKAVCQKLTPTKDLASSPRLPNCNIEKLGI